MSTTSNPEISSITGEMLKSQFYNRDIMSIIDLVRFMGKCKTCKDGRGVISDMHGHGKYCCGECPRTHKYWHPSDYALYMAERDFHVKKAIHDAFDKAESGGDVQSYPEMSQIGKINWAMYQAESFPKNERGDKISKLSILKLKVETGSICASSVDFHVARIMNEYYPFH